MSSYARLSPLKTNMIVKVEMNRNSLELKYARPVVKLSQNDKIVNRFRPTTF